MTQISSENLQAFLYDRLTDALPKVDIGVIGMTVQAMLGFLRGGPLFAPTKADQRERDVREELLLFDQAVCSNKAARGADLQLGNLALFRLGIFRGRVERLGLTSYHLSLGATGYARAAVYAPGLRSAFEGMAINFRLIADALTEHFTNNGETDLMQLAAWQRGEVGALMRMLGEVDGAQHMPVEVTHLFHS